MELAERFRYIMKLNQLSASAFADEIGVQRSSISHILSGRNKPSLEFIQKVLKRYPKVDAAWLISGTQAQRSDITLRQDQGGGVQSTEEEEVSQIETSVTDKPINQESSSIDKVSDGSTKGKIKKIVVFYEDQTFEEFNP